tara:strand:+ start:360 stop:464 length:105 start_codon:yes stop_codon:yes gene_type:complete
LVEAAEAAVEIILMMVKAAEAAVVEYAQQASLLL